MTVHELCARLDLSVRQVNRLVERGILPPPTGRTRNARYSYRHIAAYDAYLALKHNNVPISAAVAFCQDSGMTLKDYVSLRYASIRDHGLGAG